MGESKVRFGFPVRQIVLILMTALVLYLAVDFGRQVILSNMRQDDLQQVKDDVAAALQKKQYLEKRLEYVLSPQAAEEWARSVGWVKANEVPVVLVGPTAVPADAGSEGSLSPADQDANRTRWWDHFFGDR
jgi:hypothetical protein